MFLLLCPSVGQFDGTERLHQPADVLSCSRTCAFGRRLWLVQRKTRQTNLYFLDIGQERFYLYTRVGTLIVATIYLQLIQNRYMFRSFTVLQCSHLHCVQPVASDVEVVGYL